MRKTLYMGLISCVVVAALGVVCAFYGTQSSSDAGDGLVTINDETTPVASAPLSTQSVAMVIEDGLLSRDKSISLTDMDVSQDTAVEAVESLYYKYGDGNSLLDDRVATSVINFTDTSENSDGDETVNCLKVDYAITAKQLKLERTKAKKVVKSVCKAGMSQKKKAHKLHNWLVKNCAYASYSAKWSPVSASVAHTGYGALIKHRAYCSGYASAFALLCSYAKIPCTIVGGDDGAHSWNKITINGKSSYVDCTGDDSNYEHVDSGKNVSSSFFMKSRSYMKKYHSFNAGF